MGSNPISSDREAVEQYLDDRISFQELEDQIGEELAEAVQSSKKQLEQGDDLAEELVALQQKT